MTLPNPGRITFPSSDFRVPAEQWLRLVKENNRLRDAGDRLARSLQSLSSFAAVHHIPTVEHAEALAAWYRAKDPPAA